MPQTGLSGHDPDPDVPGAAARLRIWLLGRFQVAVDNQPVDDQAWRLRKAASLVKLLALAPGHALHREELLDTLWPEHEPESAANNLRYALHIARRALEPKPQPSEPRRFLRWQGERLSLAPDHAVEVDVVMFETAVHAARCHGTADTLQRAVDLHTGELLPEDRYEDWTAARREALRESFLLLLIDLAAVHEAARNNQPAIDLLRRVIALDPPREHAHVALMRLYASAGQRNQALRQYQTLRDILRETLDVEPDHTSQLLHDTIRAGQLALGDGPPSHAADPSATPRRHNLPIPITSFVGRQDEMRRLRDTLEHSRLVTLTGIGGTGKTRLALESADRLLGYFPDGVWLVELAGLADEAVVDQAVARVLSIPEEPGEPLRDTIAHTIVGQRILLVLDNCEHLIAACAELAAALLASSAGLRIIATSRQALNVTGEAVWPVPPLSTSPAAAGMDADSTQLFIDRACSRRPDLVVTPEVHRAIDEICRRVDGLPLAIELAAARVSVLSPQEIVTRLDDALGLLSSSTRLADPRHQSLRAVLDWSFDLLSQPERELFRTLAVFAGGFDLPAVEALMRGSPDGATVWTPMMILDTVSHLVDKSLVVVLSDPAGTTRYTLLEPVLHYASERLDRDDESGRTRRAHASWFLDLAEQAEPEISGGDQAHWLARLEADHDNLRAAISWAQGHEPDIAARLVARLWRFWWMHGHLTEGQRWLERVLRQRDAFSPSALAAALRAAGSLAWGQGDYERSLPFIEESLALCRQLDDTDGVVANLSALGSILANRGEYDRAGEAHEEGLALARRSGDGIAISTAIGNLADIAYYQGDYHAATTWWEENLAIQRTSSVGGAFDIAITLNNLAEVARNQHDHRRAAPLLREAIDLFRSVDFKHGVAIALCNLADVDLQLGDTGSAASRLRESLEVAGELGNAFVTATCLDGAACLAVAEGQTQHAARLFSAAEAVRGQSGAELSPADRAHLQPSVNAAKEALGEAGWDSVWREGQRLTARQAISRAQAELAQPRQNPQSISLVQQAALTARERDVTLRVARGLTNRQVADELGMATRTVDTHVSNILRKLRRTSRAELHSWAVEQGLIVTDS